MIKDAISDNHPIDRLLDGLHRDPGEGELVRHTPLIDRVFSRGSVEAILEALDAEQGEDEAFARETAAEIRKKSPTSLKVAFGQFQRGKSLSLANALKLEFRLGLPPDRQPRLSRGRRRAHSGKRPRARLAAGDPRRRR